MVLEKIGQRRARVLFVILDCPRVDKIRHYGLGSFFFFFFLRSRRFIMLTIKAEQVPFCQEPLPSSDLNSLK